MMRQARHSRYKGSLCNLARVQQGRRQLTRLALAIVATLPLIAEAYVGPGAGLSLLGALWGLVAAIGVAVLFVILWPIRRMRRRNRARRAEQLSTQASDTHPVQGAEAPSTKPPVPPRS